MIDLRKLEKILPLVEKPGRYIGNELGIVKKDTDLPIRFLYAFPDVYEVGMSNLGHIILYHLTNEREDTYAERVYCPFRDMQEQMKKEGIPLYSLETYTEIEDSTFPMRCAIPLSLRCWNSGTSRSGAVTGTVLP